MATKIITGTKPIVQERHRDLTVHKEHEERFNKEQRMTFMLSSRIPLEAEVTVTVDDFNEDSRRYRWTWYEVTL